MHDCPGRSDCRRHLRAPEAVERFDLEMFAQGENCLFWQKRITVVFERVIDFAGLSFLFRADQQFGGRNTGDLIVQRLSILRLGQPELTRAEIGVCETEFIAIGIDRAEIIRALRIEPAQFADRPRGDDLRNFAIDNLAARLWLTHLIANGDAPSGLN
ncbi:MAG: hypothetical protein Udaeo_01230 [Candidatus Udaeobacter sp.]|nr:MAG: hypothetical protein Udaeo_01230 [Candidatus Udaeobacter sp.]